MESDENENESTSKQILEYYKNVSQTRQLPRYFSGTSIAYMPEIVTPQEAIEIPQITVEETHTETLVEQAQTDVEDTTEPKTISPASSVTSNRKLEWDNGADIGYNNCNVKLQKSLSLPTLSSAEQKTPEKTEIPAQRSSQVVTVISYSSPSESVSNNKSIQSSSSPELSKKIVLSSSSSSYEKSKPLSSSSSSFPNTIAYLKSKIGTPDAESTPKIDVISAITKRVLRKRSVELCITKPISVECICIKKPGDDKRVQTSPVFDTISKQVQTSPAAEKRENQSVIVIKCDSENTNSDALASRCDSFEYLSGGGDNELPILSQLISKQQSTNLKKDVDKSIEILQKLLKSKKYDPVTKKRYIKKIVQKIVDSKYADDSTNTTTSSELFMPKKQQKLEDNIPWFPPQLSKFTVKTFSDDFLPENQKPPGFVINTSSSSYSHTSLEKQQNSSDSYNSWKATKTLSERLLEEKHRGSGDQLVKFAKNERENQICWIDNEITHLTKLKGLLEKQEQPLSGVQKTTTVYMLSGRSSRCPSSCSRSSSRNYVIQTELTGSESSDRLDVNLHDRNGRRDYHVREVIGRSRESEDDKKIVGDVEVVSDDKTTNIKIKARNVNFGSRKPSLVGEGKYDTFPKSQREMSERCWPCGMAKVASKQSSDMICTNQYTFEVPLDFKKPKLSQKVDEILTKYTKLRESKQQTTCAPDKECLPGCNCKCENKKVCSEDFLCLLNCKCKDKKVEVGDKMCLKCKRCTPYCKCKSRNIPNGKQKVCADCKECLRNCKCKAISESKYVQKSSHGKAKQTETETERHENKVSQVDLVQYKNAQDEGIQCRVNCRCNDKNIQKNSRGGKTKQTETENLRYENKHSQVDLIEYKNAQSQIADERIFKDTDTQNDASSYKTVESQSSRHQITCRPTVHSTAQVELFIDTCNQGTSCDKQSYKSVPVQSSQDNMKCFCQNHLTHGSAQVNFPVNTQCQCDDDREFINRGSQSTKRKVKCLCDDESEEQNIYFDQRSKSSRGGKYFVKDSERDRYVDYDRASMNSKTEVGYYDIEDNVGYYGVEEKYDDDGSIKASIQSGKGSRGPRASFDSTSMGQNKNGADRGSPYSKGPSIRSSKQEDDVPSKGSRGGRVIDDGSVKGSILRDRYGDDIPSKSSRGERGVLDDGSVKGSMNRDKYGDDIHSKSSKGGRGSFDDGLVKGSTKSGRYGDDIPSKSSRGDRVIDDGSVKGSIVRDKYGDDIPSKSSRGERAVLDDGSVKGSMNRDKYGDDKYSKSSKGERGSFDDGSTKSGRYGDDIPSKSSRGERRVLDGDQVSTSIKSDSRGPFDDGSVKGSVKWDKYGDDRVSGSVRSSKEPEDIPFTGSRDDDSIKGSTKRDRNEYDRVSTHSKGEKQSLDSKTSKDKQSLIDKGVVAPSLNRSPSDLAYFESVENKLKDLARKISDCRCKLHIHPTNDQLKTIQEKVLDDIKKQKKNREELNTIFNDIKDKYSADDVSSQKTSSSSKKSSGVTESELSASQKLKSSQGYSSDTEPSSLNPLNKDGIPKRCKCFNALTQTVREYTREELIQTKECICNNDNIQTELQTINEGVQCECECCSENIQVSDDDIVAKCQCRNAIVQTMTQKTRAETIQTQNKDVRDDKLQTECICNEDGKVQTENCMCNKMVQTSSVEEKSDYLNKSSSYSSSYSTDSSDNDDTTTTATTFTGDTLQSCLCCKRRNVELKQKNLGALRKQLSEQVYPLCRPCFKHSQKYDYPINYQKPNHICNCYSVVHTKTISEIKKTIDDLNEIDDRVCTCVNVRNPRSSGYCRHCKCKLRKTSKSKSGIAYVLTFENESLRAEKKRKKKKRKKSLEEIKIKIPVVHKKKHKDKENKRKKKRFDDESERATSTSNDYRKKRERLGSPEGAEAKSQEEKSRTLQEYLKKNRPEFVEDAEIRRKTVNHGRSEREKLAEDNKLEFLKKFCDNETCEKNPKRLFTSKEMKQITQRNYQKLPEVQRKLVENKEKQIRRANRLMADTFNRKLRENVLKGKRSLSTDVNVLNL